MRSLPAPWYVVAAALFLAFVAWKMVQGMRWARRGAKGDGAVRRVRARLRERMRAASSKEERAAVLRKAAEEALAELRRPDLAARWAGRAWRMQREDTESLGLYLRALEAAGRWRTLERLSWRRLATASGEERAELLRRLADLYEGRLRKPERAEALRALLRDGLPAGGTHEEGGAGA